MRKRVLVSAAIVLGLSIMTGCGKTEEATTKAEATEVSTVEATEAVEEETEEILPATEEVAETESDAEEASEEAVDGEWTYGEYTYTGDDNIIYAIDTYMCDEIAKNYEAKDIGIPVVIEVARDESDSSDIKVWGDFWYETYTLAGDTLECEAGGSYPGCMHLETTDAGCGYVVKSFDVVADGADFDSSAKEIFGDHYDKFMETYSDDVSRNEIRKSTIADFVEAHEVPAVQYKDYGWDPVSLFDDAATEEVTYMGGLFANDGKSDINMAFFNSSGLPVVIIQEGENIYYGEYVTEDATLDDGTEYTKITVEDKVYGYHFDDEDETSGIVVDQDGVSHSAIKLDESVAADMKAETE